MSDNNKDTKNTVEDLDAAAAQVFHKLANIYQDDLAHREHVLAEVHTLWFGE